MCAGQTRGFARRTIAGATGYQLKRLRDQSCAVARGARGALEVARGAEPPRPARRRGAPRAGNRADRRDRSANLALVGIPGEPFRRGLRARAESGTGHAVRVPFVAGYCNDLIGYIPTRAAYAEGGYRRRHRANRRWERRDHRGHRPRRAGRDARVSRARDPTQLVQMPARPPRPRTATGAVFPHVAHSRWRRGLSRRRQTSQTALPCSSNPAAGLTLPQVAQGLATCQARHRWHTPPPSPRNSGLPPAADRAGRDGQGS